MKVHILIFFFIFAACSRSDPWHLTTIRNSNPEHDLAKLIYPTEDPIHGLELEIVRQGDLIKGYINVFSFSIPPFQNDPHQAQVTFSTETQETAFITSRLEGGQRLSLSPLCFEALISILKQSPLMTITAGHYSQIINSKRFKENFHALLSKPFRFAPEEWLTFEFY